MQIKYYILKCINPIQFSHITIHCTIYYTRRELCLSYPLDDIPTILII